MSTGTTLGYAAAGLLAAEATGVTDVTGMGGGGDGDDDPPVSVPGGPNLTGLARAMQEAGDNVRNVTETVNREFYEGDTVRSVTNEIDKSGVSADTVTEIVQTVTDAADTATGGGGGGGGGGGSGGGGSGGGWLADLTPDEPAITAGVEGDTPLVELTEDPTGLLATKDDLSGRLSAWELEQTGEAVELFRRSADGENPIDVAKEVGDGPIGTALRAGSNPFDPENVKKSASWWANLGTGEEPDSSIYQRTDAAENLRGSGNTSDRDTSDSGATGRQTRRMLAGVEDPDDDTDGSTEPQRTLSRGVL